MNTKQDILAILEAHQGESVSGEQIARELHITRSAVWKGVRALKEEGCPITAGTNRGYLLAADSDIFSPGSVTTRLHGSAARLQVEIRPEVTSTNTVLKEEARLGAPDGKVLIALRQSAGKGRMGRSFYSPQDTGLYMSLLLRPKLTLAHSTLLTTVAAVAVAQAVDDVLGIAPPKPDPKPESFGADSPQMEHSDQAAIKWVNDVYFHGKKICGILTEAAADFESGTLEYAVVGIGINLTDPANGFPEEIRHVAGSLYGRQPAPKGIRPAPLRPVPFRPALFRPAPLHSFPSRPTPLRPSLLSLVPFRLTLFAPLHCVPSHSVLLHSSFSAKLRPIPPHSIPSFSTAPLLKHQLPLQPSHGRAELPKPRIDPRHVL